MSFQIIKKISLKKIKMALNLKLSKLITFLYLLTVWTEWPGVSQVCCQSFDKQQLPMIPLRRFGFSDKRIQKYFNHLKRLEEEILKREQAKKNKAMLDEEARRQKIYKQHLLKFQRGSNVLRDFYSNRF
jgi:hypothetical protein